jgi:hypothetical protein
MGDHQTRGIDAAVVVEQHIHIECAGAPALAVAGSAVGVLNGLTDIEQRLGDKFGVGRERGVDVVGLSRRSERGRAVQA